MCMKSPDYSAVETTPVPSVVPAATATSTSAAEAAESAASTARKKRAAGLSRSNTLLSGSNLSSAAPGTQKTLLGQ